MGKLADVLSLKYAQNPQFENLFRVELPILGDGGRLMDSDYTRTTFSQDFFSGSKTPPQSKNHLVSHRVYNVNIPMTSFETTKHTDRDSFWYSAGGADIGNISMRVDEYEDGETLKYFLQWQALISNGDGTQNAPAHYKRNVDVIKLATSGMDIHIHRYEGYYPISIADVSHGYDSAGILQYNVTLSGDSVTHIFVTSEQIKNMMEENDSQIIKDLDNPLDFKQFLTNEFDRQRQGTGELFSAINKLDKSLRI